MLLMREHAVEDYAALRDMDATDVGELRDDDHNCLEELGQYLVDSDAWQRFSVWLLHKHFEPAQGEVFVERAIHAPRGTATAPVERSAFSEEGLDATAFRFDAASGSDTAVIGMEFATLADFAGTAPLREGDEAVLAGLAERLRAHGKIDRFGVRLIRDPLGLADDELLHETSDSSERTLHCGVGKRGTVLADTTVIQTTWRWSVSEGAVDRTVMQECIATCIRAGEGHDLAHSSGESTRNLADSAGKPRRTVMQECTAACIRVGEGHDLAHTRGVPEETD
jgi:hypothetical protein